MNPLLEKLISRVEPLNNSDPNQGNRTARQLGAEVQLPLDYLEFMDEFGPGLFCSRYGVLTIWDVSSPDEQQALDMLLIHKDRSQDLRETTKYFPELTGLLPWGCDDDLYTYFWLTSEVSNWTVVIHNRHKFISLGVTFLEFITRGLDPGDDFHKYLYMLSGRVKYCPLSIADSDSMNWREWRDLTE